MKHKRLLTSLLALGLVLSLLGCGASSESLSSMAQITTADSAYEYSLALDAKVSAEEAEVSSSSGQDAKLIYRASLQMQVLASDFDTAVENLDALVEQMGGYYENRSLSHYGEYRSGSYCVRVPSEQWEDFYEQAGTLCHVVYRSAWTENVSESYYDTENRLETQQTKLDRLQELLRQASSMDDLITLESAISETEANIEALSGDLRHYDALIDYSTVDIELEEVYRLSSDTGVPRSFGERLLTALRSGISDFTDDAENFVIAVAEHWVSVLLWGVVLVLALRYGRRHPFRLSRRRKKDPPDCEE